MDFLDISLWDVFKPLKAPAAAMNNAYSTPLPAWRGEVRLTVAGKIMTAADVRWVLAQGVDFAAIGRAGILHHDFARQIIDDPEFTPRSTPVSRKDAGSRGARRGLHRVHDPLEGLRRRDLRQLTVCAAAVSVVAVPIIAGLELGAFPITADAAAVDGAVVVVSEVAVIAALTVIEHPIPATRRGCGVQMIQPSMVLSSNDS